MANRRVKDTPADEPTLQEKLGDMMEEAEREANAVESDLPEQQDAKPRRQRD